MHTTSSSLLQRLRQPADQAAWRRFVHLYTPLLHYWARRSGFHTAEADDLVQEVFTQLIQEMPRFRYDQDGSFRGWLRTVAVNKWNMIRRRREVAAGALPAELPDDGAGDPAALFAEADFQGQFLRRALELMQTDFSGPTWQAAHAVMVAGKSAAQAATALGLTVGAVHAAVFRVRARLRQELSGLLE